MYTAPDYPQGVCHIRKAAELPTAVQCAACAVIQAANPQMSGVKGQGPLCSLGGPRGPFSHVREWPPWTPKRTQGALPLDPRHLRVCSLNDCTRCALHSRWQLCCLTDVAYPLRVIRCGVHGFAMNPCESRPDSNRALLS